MSGALLHCKKGDSRGVQISSVSESSFCVNSVLQDGVVIDSACEHAKENDWHGPAMTVGDRSSGKSAQRNVGALSLVVG
jgi:hypothetical protein